MVIWNSEEEELVYDLKGLTSLAILDKGAETSPLSKKLMFFGINLQTFISCGFILHYTPSGAKNSWRKGLFIASKQLGEGD